jgi:hypothetical protein
MMRTIVSVEDDSVITFASMISPSIVGLFPIMTVSPSVKIESPHCVETLALISRVCAIVSIGIAQACSSLVTVKVSYNSHAPPLTD